MSKFLKTSQCAKLFWNYLTNMVYCSNFKYKSLISLIGLLKLFNQHGILFKLKYKSLISLNRPKKALLAHSLMWKLHMAQNAHSIHGWTELGMIRSFSDQITILTGTSILFLAKSRCDCDRIVDHFLGIWSEKDREN